MTNMKYPAIKDSYFFTQGAFYLMGILIFLPNLFLTTSFDYWMYKFRNPNENRNRGPPPPPPHTTTINPSDDYNIPEERTPYQAHITSSFGISNTISMILSIVVLFFLKHKLPSPQIRINISLISTFTLLIATTAFTFVNTDRITSALTYLSVYELVTKFPISYYSAISSGQALCGIMTSLVQITALSLKLPPSRTGTIYFGVGTVLTLVTAMVYSVIKKNSKYFIYRIGQNESDCCKEDCISKEQVKATLKKMKWFYASLVITIGTTSAMFPGFVVLIAAKERDSGLGGKWAEMYFVPVVTFLGHQFSKFVGIEAAKIVRIPKNWSYVLAVSIFRMLFIPILIFCNAQPRLHLPVLFGDDAYIVIILLFGFSEGILVNLSFLAIPTVANENEIETAVMLVPLITYVTTLLGSFLNLLIICLI